MNENWETIQMQMNETCSDGRTRVFDREGNIVEAKPLNLDRMIEHVEEVAAECEGTECGTDHKQLAEWLVELRHLRNTVQRLRQTSNELQTRLTALHKHSHFSPDGNVHITVKLSRLGKGYQTHSQVSEMAFEHSPRVTACQPDEDGYMREARRYSQLDWKIDVLKEAILATAGEAVVGFFQETEQ